jgi:hypothetical protein
VNPALPCICDYRTSASVVLSSLIPSNGISLGCFLKVTKAEHAIESAELLLPFRLTDKSFCLISVLDFHWKASCRFHFDMFFELMVAS